MPWFIIVVKWLHHQNDLISSCEGNGIIQCSRWQYHGCSPVLQLQATESFINRNIWTSVLRVVKRGRNHDLARACIFKFDIWTRLLNLTVWAPNNSCLTKSYTIVGTFNIYSHYYIKVITIYWLILILSVVHPY